MSYSDNVNPGAGSMPLYILHLRACANISPYENFSPTSLIINMMPFINNHGVSMMNKTILVGVLKEVFRSRIDVPNCSPTIADDSRVLETSLPRPITANHFLGRIEAARYMLVYYEL